MGGGMVKSNPSEVYFGGPHANMVKLKRKTLVSNLNLIQLFEKITHLPTPYQCTFLFLLLSLHLQVAIHPSPTSSFLRLLPYITPIVATMWVVHGHCHLFLHLLLVSLAKDHHHLLFCLFIIFLAKGHCHFLFHLLP